MRGATKQLRLHVLSTRYSVRISNLLPEALCYMKYCSLRLQQLPVRNTVCIGVR
jgi:hypothetical protein